MGVLRLGAMFPTALFGIRQLPSLSCRPSAPVPPPPPPHTPSPLLCRNFLYLARSGDSLDRWVGHYLYEFVRHKLDLRMSIFVFFSSRSCSADNIRRRDSPREYRAFLSGGFLNVTYDIGRLPFPRPAANDLPFRRRGRNKKINK